MAKLCVFQSPLTREEPTDYGSAEATKIFFTIPSRNFRGLLKSSTDSMVIDLFVNDYEKHGKEGVVQPSVDLLRPAPCCGIYGGVVASFAGPLGSASVCRGCKKKWQGSHLEARGKDLLTLTTHWGQQEEALVNSILTDWMLKELDPLAAFLEAQTIAEELTTHAKAVALKLQEELQAKVETTYRSRCS